MFRLNLQPANPAIARTWLIRSGLTMVGAGFITIGTLVDRLRSIFPESVLHQLPNYEQFIYMALGIAFVTALPLTMSRVVLAVSFAQLGFASSLLYLGCSIFGVFVHGYEIILLAMLVLMAVIFTILFSVGTKFAYKEKSWSDVVLGALLTLFFLGVWIFPVWKIWSRT